MLVSEPLFDLCKFDQAKCMARCPVSRTETQRLTKTKDVCHCRGNPSFRDLPHYTRQRSLPGVLTGQIRWPPPLGVFRKRRATLSEESEIPLPT